ncbi:unnamed protein product [Parascedosporium putredinis]|uniref:SET domain-containing protein n=1 Tax=Parascedosporium putredinis TaxID=1442378 RepID=A0A9P1H9N3_9PEZI|nr:unnamed protein product [Parascedosporium putredinis]CAI8002034.1 unnamed protein product [Parascedosporium putredinis]
MEATRGEDLFAGLKAESVPEEKGLTVRAKFKLHTSSNRKSNSSAGKRNLNLPVVALKTEAEAVPPYRFHHIEIPKSVLTPQTMLKYVPHVRDLDDSEERQYNLWLQELDEMDAASGFKPQSREQRAANTKRDETAARLATMLPSWLKTLSIEGCTKANLIRYMASEARDDTITPQQKTSLIDSCRKVDDIGSPRSIRAVKQFTEAFDLVFSRERSEYPVTLRDVLFRDDFVDQIVDPKRLTKEVIAPSKPTETLEPADGYLETHSLLACLICFCNSCDHGEYDNKNQKRTFSMEVMGGVEGALKRRPLRLTRDRATQEEKVLYSQPCGDECFQLIDGEIPPGVMTPWTTRELRILRALVETSPVGPSFRLPECTISGFLQRPCWEVHLKMKQAKLGPKVAPATTPPKPVKNLAWYDRHRKMLVGDWQEHTRVYEHQRRWRVVREVLPLHGGDLRLNRECDPALCKGCGAIERVDPANLGDDDLHQTGCQNCALQRGQTKRLMLGKSLLDGCGYGLFTAEDIAQDEFVIEYVGELITHDEGYDARRGAATYSTKDPMPVYGNLSRYINHASESDKRACNIMPKILYVNGEYRIRFSAMRDIRAGEELFFNYGENFPNLTKKLLEDRADQVDEPSTAAEGSSRVLLRRRGGDARGGRIAKGAIGKLAVVGDTGAARSRKRARRTDTEVQEEEAILEAMGSPSRPPRRTGAAAASSRTRKSNNTGARSVDLREAAEAAEEEGHVSDSDSAPLAHRRASRQDHRVATDSSVDEGGQGETVVHRTALRQSEEENLETNTADEQGREGEGEDGDEDEDGTPEGASFVNCRLPYYLQPSSSKHTSNP